MGQGKVQVGKVILDYETAKRGGIRWAYGSEQSPRSSTWRAWCNPKGDFYLSVRHLSTVVKVSLHRDGKCSVGFTGEHWGGFPEDERNGKSRHWDLWQVQTDTLVRACQVVVPGTELRAFPSREEANMRWLPPPSSSEIGVVSIFTAPTDSEPDSWPGSGHGSQPLAILATPSRLAWFVHFSGPYDEPTQALIAQYRAQLARISPVQTGVGLRSVIGGHNPDQSRVLIEIAWQDVETGGNPGDGLEVV